MYPDFTRQQAAVSSLHARVGIDIVVMNADMNPEDKSYNQLSEFRVQFETEKRHGKELGLSKYY
jgi:hypothetical protein